MNLFFCTKPLQYLNCRNLASARLDEENVLVVTPNFHRADLFADNVRKYDDLWSSVILSNKTSFFDSGERYSGAHVFVDTDLHLELKFLEGQSCRSVSVYEEGLGTYAGRLTRVTNSWWKDLIIWLACWSGLMNCVMGQNKITKDIYVHNPEAYRKASGCTRNFPISFPTSFIQNIENNEQLFIKVFNISNFDLPVAKRVCVFMTSNCRLTNFLESFQLLKSRGEYDHYFFKAHPNVADLYPDFSCELAQIPAEFLLSRLISNGNFVHTFHYGTATTLYIVSPSLNFFDMRGRVDL